MEEGENRDMVFWGAKCTGAVLVPENQPRLCFSEGTLDPTHRTGSGSNSDFPRASHHLCKSGKAPNCKVSAAHKALFQTETYTLGKSSEGKFQLRQCPFNQKAVGAFFSPLALAWRDNCPKDIGCPNPTDAGRSLGCVFWGIYHRWIGEYKDRGVSSHGCLQMSWLCVLGHLPLLGWESSRTR